MSLATLFCHDLVVVAPAMVEDDYSNEVKDWATGTRTSVRGRVVQRTREENRLGREAEMSEWVCYLPPGTTVDGQDRVEWDDGGLTFEVKGRPNRAFGRRVEHHIECSLELIEG